MKLLPSLFLAVCAVWTFAHPVEAAVTENVLENATVNLFCLVDAGKKTMGVSGSGVFIHERGVILTNAHVAQYFLLPTDEGRVTANCSVRTGSPAENRYNATVLYFPYTWIEDNKDELKKRSMRGTGEQDFALLYVTGAHTGALPESFPAIQIDLQHAHAEREAVTLLGYPSEGKDFEGIQNKLELVAATSTIENHRGMVPGSFYDLLTIAHSAVGASGSSGGPIADADHELIGIIVGKSTVKDDRTVRGITLPYIDRTLRAQTGLSLSSLLVGNAGLRAEITKLLLPANTVSVITKSILKRK